MNFTYENSLKRKKGYTIIAGVDEAGRGPLAGPVFASAFVFLKPIPAKAQRIINDSKALSAQHREQCFEQFVEWKKHRVVDFATSFVRASTIDKYNIQYATITAMQRSVQKLRHAPTYIIVDKISYKKYTPHLFPTPYEVRIKADAHIISVAAASIISKVMRDRTMVRYHNTYPLYGFDKHKGYGTQQHYRALRMYGTTPLHRKSFQLLVYK